MIILPATLPCRTELAEKHSDSKECVIGRIYQPQLDPICYLKITD